MHGAASQQLTYYANGRPMRTVGVTSGPFVHEIEISDLPEAGVLGTFWHVERADLRSRTIIGNPVFLQSTAEGTDQGQ